MTARIVGWAFICMGVISLATVRQRGRVLILALCGVIPGPFVGVLVRDAMLPLGPTMSGYQRSDSIIPWVVTIVFSMVALIAGVIAAHFKQNLDDASD